MRIRQKLRLLKLIGSGDAPRALEPEQSFPLHVLWRPQYSVQTSDDLPSAGETNKGNRKLGHAQKPTGANGGFCNSEERRADDVF